MSVVTSRSWSIMHNGLSSALLLGLLGVTARDAEVQDLQDNILEIFSESGDGTASSNPETNSEISPPHARAIVALKSNILHTGGHVAPETGNVGRFQNVATGACEPPAHDKKTSISTIWLRSNPQGPRDR
ncbi:hypothetical protein EAF00_008032 [Botryotinia globosa]|nr:hypothetical protein EAF00_008032 [Botryotinia globosa]